MRITMLLPPDALVGGIRVVSIYAQRLAQRGHRVTVIQPRHPRPSWRETFRCLRHHHHWPKPLDNGPSFFDHTEKWVERIQLPHAAPVTAQDVPDADVVLATWWETAEWAWSLLECKGRKVHFMQDYEIWAGHLDRVDATCRLPIPKIVIAKWVANLLSSRFGQEPMTLIPNSVDTALFNARPRSRQKIPTVGFTYTPMRNKGTDITLQAIELARRQIPELKVITFGSLAPVCDMPIPSNAEFFFRVPDRDLASIYSACDAWLFGTRIEGFGLPILEAMACRTPVIGTPAGAAPELLQHGGGMQIPMENPAAMADAIVHMCRTSESEWKRFSDAAYLTATSYTWDDATDRFEAALEQVRAGETMPMPERVSAARWRAVKGEVA